MEGGFCTVIRMPSLSKSTVILYCQHRTFELTFDTPQEMEEWVKTINLVLSKQIQMVPYQKRLKAQRELLGQSSTDLAIQAVQAKLAKKLKDV